MVDLLSKTISLKKYVELRKNLNFNNIEKIALVSQNGSYSVKIVFKYPMVELDKDYSSHSNKYYSVFQQ